MEALRLGFGDGKELGPAASGRKSRETGSEVEQEQRGLTQVQLPAVL